MAIKATDSLGPATTESVVSSDDKILIVKGSAAAIETIEVAGDEQKYRRRSSVGDGVWLFD